MVVVQARCRNLRPPLRFLRGADNRGHVVSPPFDLK